MGQGRDHLAGDYWLEDAPTTTVTIEIPVDYTGCESEQERAKVRVDAKHKARQQIATQPLLLEALENLENDDGSIPKYAWELVKGAVALGNAPID